MNTLKTSHLCKPNFFSTTTSTVVGVAAVIGIALAIIGLATAPGNAIAQLGTTANGVILGVSIFTLILDTLWIKQLCANRGRSAIHEEEETKPSKASDTVVPTSFIPPSSTAPPVVSDPYHPGIPDPLLDLRDPVVTTTTTTTTPVARIDEPPISKHFNPPGTLICTMKDGMPVLGLHLNNQIYIDIGEELRQLGLEVLDANAGSEIDSQVEYSEKHKIECGLIFFSKVYDEHEGVYQEDFKGKRFDKGLNIKQIFDKVKKIVQKYELPFSADQKSFELLRGSQDVLENIPEYIGLGEILPEIQSMICPVQFNN